MYDNFDIDSQSGRLKQIKDWWSQAYNYSTEENLRIAKNFQFYVGGELQWDSAVIKKLDSEGKPHISINKIMPYVNTLSGYQRQIRDSLVLFPRQNATEGMASALTQLGRYTMESSRPTGDYVISESFINGLIGSKWWMGWRDNFSQDPLNGDISPESVSCFRVFEDPMFQGYDIDRNDPFDYCRFVFRVWLLEAHQIKKIWSEKKDVLKSMSTSKSVLDMTLAGLTNDLSGSGDDYTARVTLGMTENDICKRYIVRRCYFKTWETSYMMVDTTNQQKYILDASKEKIDKLADSNPNFRVISYTKPIMHMATYLGDVELDYEKDPYNGNTNYPLTRFCPYWVDGKSMGMVDNLIDPQKELNKRRSQLLHHLNQSANSGFMAEEGSLTPEQLDNWRQNMSSSGFIGLYTGPNKPTPIQPTQLSGGHLTAAEMADRDFDTITNLENITLSSISGRESGEALKTRRDSGLTTNEVIFDNFNHSQVSYFTNLVSLIQRPDKMGRYRIDENEIMRIVEDSQLNVSIDEIRNLEAGTFGVKVGRSQTTQTAKDENFQKLMALIERIPDIVTLVGPETIIEESTLGNKEMLMQKVKEKMIALQQQAQIAQPA